MLNVTILLNGRKERNNINYRCNYRLKYGKDKCSNDAMVEEDYINKLIEQQLDVINMKIENVDINSIIDREYRKVCVNFKLLMI